MDEEKEQNNGQAQKPGSALNKGFKKLKEQGKRKVFRKAIAAIIAVLLKAIIAGLAIAIVITAISHVLDKIQGEESKEAYSSTIDYSSEITADTSPNRVIVDSDNITENGAYKLTYEFRDDNGNLYTEQEAISNIKSELLKENEKIDLTVFSDSELKMIGTLMYNGLETKKYNEEKLKALVIFAKADIASQNFDLRSADKIGNEVDLEEMAKSDYVYGTLQIHRTKAAEGYGSEQKLEYIPYGDENTPGTFCYMDKQEDMNIMNKFSIDEEGKAVYAKWSKSIISYVYKDENKKEISAEELSQIVPEDDILENINRTFITTTSFNYKQYISRYGLNYGLLSDLLIITNNADFCLDLANQAFNGKIVINVKEELSITDSTKVATYTQTKLLYDYVEYQVSGQKAEIGTEWEIIETSTSNPKTSVILASYGWSSSMTPISENKSGSSGQIQYTYQWTNEDVAYKLVHSSKKVNSIEGHSWVLYMQDITYTNLPTKKNNGNILINLEKNHVTEKYEDYTIDEDYTEKQVFTYTIETITHSEGNKCSYEISELDCWYLKYYKQYEAPTVETSDSGNEKKQKGEYPQEITEVTTTKDANEINKVQVVKDFINQKEEEYINDNSASKAECTITRLTIKERVKTDEVSSYSGSTTKYKFGEEIADTTEAQMKNVEYVNNQPVFTKEDGEIGFLYIYDNYISQGLDLYLQNDSEKRLFELLEEDSTTSKYSNVIKYLLYIYDGIDRGVTKLTIKIVDIEAMNKIKGSSTANYIKAWENGGLWMYETGQSTVFPSRYMTEDELNYIVYEDGSAGHNNITYGICTFISSDTNVRAHNEDWGDGYYNWVTEFEEEGILVENLYEGAYVDRAVVDYVFVNKVLPTFVKKVNNYLDTNLPEYKFSKSQKDALIAICYQYGNISGFAEAYRSSLNEDGTVDAEKIKSYSRFDYSGTINDRKYANWLLFTEGTYIDRAGNRISVGSGSVVEAAYEVADYFLNSGVEVYYAADDVAGCTPNGRHCVYSNIQGSWDLPIQRPETYGIVCATFVTFAIWKAGLIDEETINKYGYNATGGVNSLLTASEYAGDWEIITTWDELEEGDIVLMEGHVFIYMDGDKCFDQCYCVVGSLRGQLYSASQYRSQFIRGYRYIG